MMIVQVAKKVKLYEYKYLFKRIWIIVYNYSSYDSNENDDDTSGKNKIPYCKQGMKYILYN